MATFYANDQTTFEHAIANYGSGDTVRIAPGDYLTHRQIARDGGTLHLEQWATIRNTWDQCFLFDDDDTYGDMGVTSFRVTGQGRLESVGGIVRTHGGNDNWHIEASTIDGMGNQIGYIYSGSHLTIAANSIINAGGNAAFEVNGSLQLEYNTVSSTSARSWCYAHPGASVTEIAEPVSCLLLLAGLVCWLLFRH